MAIRNLDQDDFRGTPFLSLVCMHPDHHHHPHHHCGRDHQISLIPVI